jgi:hypothetical protein
MTFMDRAVEGKLGVRRSGGPVAPTVDQIRTHNALYDPFYEQDVKMSLKFASKTAFGAWLQHLSATEQAKYAKYRVVEDDKGNVLVYKRPFPTTLLHPGARRYTLVHACIRYRRIHVMYLARIWVYLAQRVYPAVSRSLSGACVRQIHSSILCI